ncbi:Sec-independent protein translocase protein TATA, chloroplastic-like protein [Drosera capensis]
MAAVILVLPLMAQMSEGLICSILDSAPTLSTTPMAISLLQLSLPSLSRPHFSFNPTLAPLHPQTPTGLSLNRTRPRRNRTAKGFKCNALFGLGVPELVVIAGVAALVFGPKNLPQVGKSIGKTVKSFQQAAKEFESELKKDPDTLSDAVDPKPIAASLQEKDDSQVATSKDT